MSGSVSNTSVLNLVNLLAPASGTTHGARFTVTLTGNSASVNWVGLFQQIGTWLPQAMAVDNTASASPVTISETTFGWTRTVQAGQYRVFQFPAVGTPTFVFSSTGSAAPIVVCYDFPAFPDSDFNPAVASGTPVSITGQPIEVIALATQAAAHPVTYAKPATTTIALGGTSQTVFGAGTIANGAWVTNPSTATELLFIDPTGGACAVVEGGSTFALQPGQTLSLGAATNAVTANAATTGHAFSAVYF